MSVLRPSARLDVPSAVTKRISSVAYAVDEMASDEKTASAMIFGIRWCSCSALDSGRPTRMRLTRATGRDSVVDEGEPGVWHARPGAFLLLATSFCARCESR